MAKPKYRGKLLEPIHPGIIELGLYGSFSEWAKSSDRVIREYAGRTLLLFKHYQIDPKSRNCWSSLALALAENHVPGFAVVPIYRGRGRPKKARNLDQQATKSRGRPVTNTLDDAYELVRIVDGYKAQLQSELDRRITDKEVLERLITNFAKNQKKSVLRTVSKELPRYQKLLSESRGKIRKNQE